MSVTIELGSEQNKSYVVFSVARPPPPVFQKAPSRSIELPFDILDRIFSLLKSHPKALLACSNAHSVFSQIVEKYRFHHIVISIGLGDTKFANSLDPSNLRKHLAETPRIAKYVTVLQIEFNYIQHPPESECGMASIWEEMAPLFLKAHLEEIASLLPMFPVLECIMLPTLNSALRVSESALPQSFRIALENCLHLPTLQEIHIGDMSFPLSMLDNHANINHLALSGPPKIEREYLETTYPQIKSLEIGEIEGRYTEVFRTWAKRHTIGLQSLKFDLSCHRTFLDVLRTCSDTLENLHLCLHRQGTPRESSSRLMYQCADIVETGHVELIDLSSLPRLRHLTIHAEMFVLVDDDYTLTFDRRSYLPKAIEILETASSLHQLTIEIYVDPFGAELENISLSPLRALAAPSACFSHIDLYIYTGSPWCPVTQTIMNSLLAKHKGLMKLIERGVLAVHPEETAPTLSRSYIARENEDISPLAHLAGPLRSILTI